MGEGGGVEGLRGVSGGVAEAFSWVRFQDRGGVRGSG